MVSWYHDGLPYKGAEPTPFGNETCLAACQQAGCMVVPEIQVFDVIADESERNNLAPSNPALVKELVSLLESEVGRGAEKAGGAAAASPRSPLLSEWMEDFSLPPKVSLAGLLGALGTHRPDALHRAVDLGVLRPLSGMLDQGNPRERELVSSLLLVMMTASERA